MARTYDNRGREAAAARTRQRIIDAAAACFTTDGYAATSLTAIADGADVSVETVKKGFGTKRHLLKSWFDDLVGGDHGTPVAQQDAVTAVATGRTLDQRLAGAATALAAVHRRAAPAHRVVAAATHADPEVASWWDREQLRREQDVQTITAAVLGDASDGHGVGRLIDELFVLSDPHVYLELTGARGWSDADYTAWFVRVARHAIDHRPNPTRRTS